MSRLPNGAARDLIYRHIRQAAVDDVFGETMASLARAAGCTRETVKSAVKSLVRDGVLAVEARAERVRPAEYRIMEHREIIVYPARVFVAPPPKPPRKVKPDPTVRAEWFTKDRAALMFRWWPTYLPVQLILAEMRKLPGPPVPRSISGMATRRGIRRPDDVLINKTAIAEAIDQFSGVRVKVVAVPVPQLREVFPEQGTRLVAPGTYRNSGYSMLRAR